MRAPWCVPLLAVLLSGSLAGPLPALRAQAGPAPDVAERVAAELTGRGFANVAAVVDGSRVVATLENTRHRDERVALREAAALLLPELDPGQELVLVPTHRAVPLVAARYAPPDSTPAEVSLDVSGLPPALRDAPRSSRSFGRIDVVVHPWFEAVFGAYLNPVASRTGVAPELRVALRPGLALAAQALVTLQDDIPTGETRVRPGLVTLSQLLRLPRGVFISATAGAFNPDRYGVDVEARAYTPDGRWSAGAQAGLTGAASYAREGWGFAPLRERTALVDVAWRSARYDLVLRTTAGMFLEEDRGVRLDVVRQFGELEVGWFLVESREGANGGFTLRIPLLPARHPAPAPVRLRPADAFRWQYRYKGLVPGGWRYTTGSSLDELTRRLNPDHVAHGYP